MGIDFINIGQIPAKDIECRYSIDQKYERPGHPSRHDFDIDTKKTGDMFKYEGTLFPQQSKIFLKNFTIRPKDNDLEAKVLSSGKGTFNIGGLGSPNTYLIVMVTYKYGADNIGKYYKVYSLKNLLRQYSTFSALRNSRLTLDMLKEDYE